MEHLKRFYQALDMVKSELLIVSPWIRRLAVTDDVLDKFGSALDRGVKIRIYYGYGNKSWFDLGDSEFIGELKKKFAVHQNFTLETRGERGTYSR